MTGRAPSNPQRTTARTIRAARAYAGISRDELGRRVGLGGGTIGNYERGNWQEKPKRGIVDAIGVACGVPVDWMHTGWPATRQPDRPADRP